MTYSELRDVGKTLFFQHLASYHYTRTGILPSFRILERPTEDKPWPQGVFNNALWEHHKKVFIPWLLVEPLAESSEDEMDTNECGVPSKRRAQSPTSDENGSAGPDRNKRCHDPSTPVPTSTGQPRSAEYIQQKIDEYNDSDEMKELNKKIAEHHYRHQESLKRAERLILEQSTTIDQLKSQLSNMSTVAKSSPTVLDDSWPPSASSIIQMDRTLPVGSTAVTESMSQEQRALSPSSQCVSDRLLGGSIANLGVEVFTGFSCNNTENWIRRFEIKCKAALASCLRAFPSYCDDKTYMFLQGMKGLPTIDMVSPAISHLDLWNQLKIVIIKQFAGESDQQLLTEELYRRKQLSGESVGAYATELTVLGSRLNPPWTPIMIKPVLIKGLDPAIVDRFPKLTGDESFSWVIDQARYWESRRELQEQQIIKREARGSLHVMDAVPSHSSDEEQDQSRHRLAAFTKKPCFKPYLDRAAPTQEHWDRRASQSKTSNQRPYDGTLQCRQCGRVGHSSSTCLGKLAGRTPRDPSTYIQTQGTKLCSFDKHHSAAVSGFARDADQNWVHVAMLADSGADENFITSSFVQRLKLGPNSSKSIEYKDGSNKSCSTLGSLTLKIRLHVNVFFHAKFHIIETCPYEVILGPALAIKNGSFDFRSRSLQFPGGITIPSASAVPAELANDQLAIATFLAGKHTNSLNSEMLDDLIEECLKKWHTGPSQMTQYNGHFSYWVQHVTSGVKHRVRYLHTTLAPESTQIKYRGVSSQKEGERSESPVLIPPLRSNMKHKSTSMSTFSSVPASTSPGQSSLLPAPTILHIDPDHRFSQSEVDATIGNPFSPHFKDTLRVDSSSTSPGTHNKLTEPLVTQITPSGRSVVVPTRYLNMFLAFQTPGHLQPGASTPDARERGWSDVTSVTAAFACK